MNKDDWSLKMMENKLNEPISDYEGLSDVEMESLINIPFSKFSPVQLKTNINPEVLSEVPFLLLVEAYLKYIIEKESLKLTSIGNLPRELLHYLYGLGYIKEEMIESGLLKLSKEKDSIPMQN